MLSRKDLEVMGNDELKKLIEQAQEVLKERENKEKKEFEFEFKATAIRKRHPYVAKLVLSNGKNGRKKLDRQFFEFERYYDSLDVTVEGSYMVEEGSIIEKRLGGNWREEIRKVYIVSDGRELEIDFDKRKIMKYLEGKITKEELIRDNWVNEVN